MPVTYKTYGDQVVRGMEAAIRNAVDKSAGDVLKTAKSMVAVDTGKMFRSMVTVKAKVDGDEIYSLVSIPVSYAVFSELKTKALRRALASNAQSSLKNFENII